jgi:DHA2 family multidrug resistance protein
MSAEAIMLSRPGRRQATVALMIATAMQAFDATIANVALPQLEQSLGGGIALGSWVMTSYLCASAIMAILTGWLRRRYGARPLFIGSIGLFVAASGLCAVAPSSLALIQFRLVQGAAAGVIQPLAQAILLDIYPPQDHGRMLAVWGAAIMAGPILGPILGGVIADVTSWRWIFVLNFPLGLIAISGLAHVPASVEPAVKAPIDGIGLTLLVIGVGALQLALERRTEAWPLSAETAVEAGIAALAFVSIGIRTVRSRFTLFRFQVFRNLNFSAAVFYNYLIGALLFTTIVFLPQLSEGPLGFDATQAGLTLSPRGIGTMATMLAVHYVIDRIDSRALLAAGIVITAAALALMSQVPPDGGKSWLAAASAMQGIGVGLLFTPLSSLAFSTLAAELRTDAAGVYSLLRQLGCATGVAVMTTLLQAKIDGKSLRMPETAASEALGYGVFAAYTGCFRMMAIVTAITLPGILLFRVLRHGSAPAAAD